MSFERVPVLQLLREGVGRQQYEQSPSQLFAPAV
jgi:hypothetical protein